MQADDRILAPKSPAADALRDHIEEVRAKALTLRKVEVRKENGVIVID